MTAEFILCQSFTQHTRPRFYLRSEEFLLDSVSTNTCGFLLRHGSSRHRSVLTKGKLSRERFLTNVGVSANGRAGTWTQDLCVGGLTGPQAAVAWHSGGLLWQLPSLAGLGGLAV